MSDVKYKYFQITEKETLDYIESCLQSIEIKDKALKELSDNFGANDCLQYNSGGVAAFTFSAMPDRNIWKKVKHGYMPKANTKESTLLKAQPKELDYRDSIKRYGFGNEMIIGERVATGFRMLSSSIKGNRKANFYVIKVPYQGDFERDIDKSLVEIKEWEMIKGVEEGSL